MTEWEKPPSRRAKEATAEQRFVEWCRREGINQRKLQDQGKRGYPDRTVYFGKGRTGCIEFKAPGKKARPDQKRVHQQLVADGVPVLVTDSYEEAVQWVIAHRRSGSRKSIR